MRDKHGKIDNKTDDKQCPDNGRYVVNNQFKKLCVNENSLILLEALNE